MKRITNYINKENYKEYNDNPLYLYGIVKKCIYDKNEKYPIGTIFFNLVTNSSNPNNELNSTALPLLPNETHLPIENEIVIIFSLPEGQDIQFNTTSLKYYYLKSINIWNNINHNMILDIISSDKSTNNQKFTEKDNLYQLQPYIGDIIYTGRWGQSIRFGSTGNLNENNWSNNNKKGDPITIIRNNQYEEKDKFNTQTEQLNKEESSIWLTSTQNIKIKEYSAKKESFIRPPIQLGEYTDPQTIIHSGRVLLMSNKDCILMNSYKDIHLSSNDNVNIDSKNTTIDSNSILLGGKNATESAILGDSFLTDLLVVMKDILTLSQSLQTPIGTPSPFVPNVSIAPYATQLSISTQKMINKIEKYKSKTIKIL
jgi:hypothetical protein